MTNVAAFPIQNAAAIKRLANGFCHAKLLLTANELDVFADLHRHGPSAEAELIDRIGLRGRGSRELLHGLVLLGLLELRDGHYTNSAAATATLIPGQAEYIGGFLRRADHMLYPAWQHLPQALTTGKPQTPDAGAGAFQAMLADPHQLDQYLRMMDSANGLVTGHLAEAIEWDQYQDIADIGGCRGNLAAGLITRHPHLHATVMDLPPMAAPLAEHAAKLGLAHHIRFQAGDFFTDPLPTADVLILGHVLHNWSVEQRKFLVSKAYDAVNPGGALLIYDAMLSDEPTDLGRILISLNMLLVTEAGSEYTVGEGSDWLAAAGCADIGVRPLGHTDTVLIGRKPAIRK